MKIITAQKMKFSSKDFFSKCDQIRSFLRIWPHLLKKSLMEKFIFSALNVVSVYDLMGGNLSQDTVHVISRMVKCKDGEFMVKLMPVQQQANSNYCYLFVLAFATDLLKVSIPQNGTTTKEL